jgi:hypothetical protein
MNRQSSHSPLRLSLLRGVQPSLVPVASEPRLLYPRGPIMKTADQAAERSVRGSASSATAHLKSETRLASTKLGRTHLWASALALAGLSWLVGCGSKPPEAKAPPGPSTLRTSDASARESVAITVYNSNFGLVREARRVHLDQGRVELSFADVSAFIQPETVYMKSLDDPEALTVLEQNYRYDLLTPEKLLEKYVGQKIRVARYNEKLGTDEIQEAEVVSVEGSPVLRINGEIVTGSSGRLIFPRVPENLVSKPTLVWLLESQKPEQRVEVSYLTAEMKWQADYVLVLSADDKRADLSGWVTLENRSGASYKNAELKLVAGDVQRVAPPLAPPAPEAYGYAFEEQAAPAPSFREEGLFEYHLYTLERPTDLLDNEQKQVSLLEAHDVPVTKKLTVRGQEYWYSSRQGQVLKNQKVSAFVEFENSEKSELGMPLPKGTLRVYKASQSGALEFVGEDTIDHTPRDEKVHVHLGESFDVVVDQKQIEYRRLSNCAEESVWEVALRNHKDLPEVVDVEEPVSGDYSIESSSQPVTKKDAQTFTFTVPVPARGEVKLSYRIRITHC